MKHRPFTPSVPLQNIVVLKICIAATLAFAVTAFPTTESVADEIIPR